MMLAFGSVRDELSGASLGGGGIIGKHDGGPIALGQKTSLRDL